jgi:transcriptional antiterminator RfaH
MDESWVVLRCQTRRETLAERAVNARGVETYLPWISTGDEGGTPKPLFPGYLFTKLSHNSDDLLRVRSAPGVAYVLPRAGTPALLPQLFIDKIREQERAHAEGHRTPTFAHGDRVVVVSGPFKWAEGLFDRTLTPAGRVRILLELVHGSAAIQLDALSLRQVGQRAFQRGAA